MPTWELDLWRAVPDDVRAGFAKHAGAAASVAARYARCPHRVFWEPDTGRSTVVRRPTPGYLLVKAGDYDFLRRPADAFAALQKPLGGPHTVAATLVGGALGAGLGYAGGTLAERALPEEDFRRGRLRKTLAIAGGLAGAVPGAAWSAVNAANSGHIGTSPLGALFSGWPFHKGAGLEGVDPMFLKAAMDAGGDYYMPTIPVDAFNRVVWSDVLQPPNPYGTRSSFGDDEQPLRTPPWAAATATGLLAGTAAATGREAVSPWQLAQTAAASAGTGYLAATAFGKTLGALAGLSPGAQRQLQQAGLWGGLINGAVTTLFGGR